MTKRFWIALTCLLGMTTSPRADLLWGANGHPFSAYPGIPVERQLDYLEDLGMKSYRVNFSDVGKASELATLVKEAKARGLTILPALTPFGRASLDKESPEELYRKSREFAVQLASEFKDDIPVWELGNEMENYAIIKPCEKRDDGTQYPCEWGPASGDGVLDYYGPRWVKVSAVLKGMSDGLISVDPKLRKAIGTAGWGHVGAFERMQKDGILWDISVWHTYGEDPKWAFDILARYGHPIWVTEFNNPYGSQRGEEEQAIGLERMMSRLRELQGTYDIEAAHVYELLDETYWDPSYEAFMGLVHLKAADGGGWRTGEPKPAYFRVRDIIRGPRSLPRPERSCELAASGVGETLAARKVAYSYCLVLGRDPDESGRANWTVALDRDETDVPNMVLSMLFSDEFTSRYRTFGLTDSAYVSFLYLLLLDREADPGGLASYVRQLDAGVSRGSVAYGMTTSGEFRNKHPVLFEIKGAEGTASTSPG